MVRLQRREGVDKLLELPRAQMGHISSDMTETYVTEHLEVMKELLKGKCRSCKKIPFCDFTSKNETDRIETKLQSHHYQAISFGTPFVCTIPLLYQNFFMLYNRLTRIKFNYQGEEVNFHVEHETDDKLLIACFHPIFKRKFDRFAVECNTCPSSYLLPDITHRDYLFFDAFYKALVNQVSSDFDKNQGLFK